MKLNIIEQGHWEIVPNYPNATIKSKSRERLSYLVDPSDRDRFINWSKGKKSHGKKGPKKNSSDS